VNVSGLQHRRPGPGEDWRTAAVVDEARLAWIASEGATVIRLPLSQDWLLGEDAPGGARDYLEAVDEVVHHANARGLYVIVCLHALGWRTIRGTPTPYLPPLPDAGSVTFWERVAERFAGRPGVLFDLLNEPHSTRPGRPEAGVRAWHDWVRRLHAVVRRRDPHRLMLVSGFGGPCWSSDLSSFPVRESAAVSAPPLPDVIYAAHLYRHGAPWLPARRQTCTIRGWRRLIERPAAAHPIFVAEWGAGETPRDARWTAALLTYLESLAAHDSGTGRWRGLAGWTAWSVGDAPHITAPGAGDAGTSTAPVLTAHGARVIAALSRAARVPASAPAGG
jgi:endoglucanase